MTDIKQAFHGKTVIITGGSSGLGAALAREFARMGANTALFSPDGPNLEAVAAECRELGAPGALAVVGDATVPDDCRRLVDETVAAFGGVDYLIANAGVSMWERFDEVRDLGVFKRIMDINYLGTVHCVHFALPHLRKTKGMIAATVSIQGEIPVPLHTGYVASKHAVLGFLNTLRMEIADSGVDILAVLPHWLRGTNLRAAAFRGDGNVVGEGTKKHNKESISVDDASRAIIDAIAKRKRRLVIPAKLRPLPALFRIWPGLVEKLVGNAVSKQK